MYLSHPQVRLANQDESVFYRVKVPQNNKFVVDSLGIVDMQTGDAPNGLLIDIFKDKSNRSVFSRSIPYEEGQPIATLNVGGDTIGIRLWNKSGTTRDVAGFISASIQ